MEQNTQSSENNNQVENSVLFRKPKKKNNKKIILLIGAIIVILGAIALYFSFFSDKEDENVPVLEDEKVGEIDKELDSDQDGLPDYIEEVLGTDLNNSDTDGDGYSDFEEIKNGYSPIGDKKYTEEEWEAVKEEMRNEDKEFYKNIFINCEYKKGEYEIRYYDSSGRVTGLVNGEIKEEIPDFTLSDHGGSVMALIPQEVCVYEIFNIKEGNYVLSLISSDGLNLISFNATNIPIFPGETHRYVFNWDAISRGDIGTILSIDIDGDNIFEKEINVDSEFTCEEFISQM